MQSYEYIAVPAPRKGVSSKGVKGVPGKFANAITALMNEMAAEGWDYQRSDTLPCEERQGLTGKAVKYHAMLIFRRAVETETQEDHLALPSPDEVEVNVEEADVFEAEPAADDDSDAQAPDDATSEHETEADEKRGET